MSTPPLIVETEGLSRDFSGRLALDRVTLAIQAGTVFGLLGPNGAGKTTTIRLLLGLLTPTSGSARVFGFDTRTSGDMIRSKTGALLEHTGLYERLSAEDNLGFYARVARFSPADRRGRIMELLMRIGLWERRGEIVATWSRGMKQKLAIARAMLHRPPLLFLDEPTAGLDPIAAAELRADIAGLVAGSGITVFLTTHNLPEAESLCQTVAVLRDGKVLAIGSPRDVRSGNRRASVDIAGRGFNQAVLNALHRRPEVESATTGDGGGRLSVVLRPGADVAALITLIVGMGGEVEEVRRGHASLEDAFRDLVLETP